MLSAMPPQKMVTTEPGDIQLGLKLAPLKNVEPSLHCGPGSRDVRLNCTLTDPEAVVTVAVTTMGPAVLPAVMVVPALPDASVVALRVPSVAEPEVTAKVTGVPANGWLLVSITWTVSGSAKAVPTIAAVC